MHTVDEEDILTGAFAGKPCAQGPLVAMRCTLADEEALRTIRKHVDALRAHIEGVRRGAAEGIHDMRVASRRLRAALSENAPLFGKGPRSGFRKKVRALTRLLGTPREFDVTLGLLRAWRLEIPHAAAEAADHVYGTLRSQREAATTSIREALSGLESPAFEQSFSRLQGSHVPASKCYRETGARRLQKQLLELGRFHRHWTDTGRDEALHKLRIRFKKLRYAAEAYAPLYGSGMKPFIRRLKDAQEALGEWNDQRILRDHVLRAGNRAPPHIARGLALFSRRLDEHVAGLERRFAADAARFFSDSEQRTMRSFLGRPLRACCNEASQTAAPDHV